MKMITIVPEQYKYSEFFHKAIDYARERSLNTNELCLELSVYLFEHKKELKNAERRWKYNDDRLRAYWKGESKW